MIRHKVRRSVVLGAVLALLLTVGAGTAYAHTAQILIQSGTLIYQQIPGIDVNYDNDVTIVLNAPGAYYEVDDPGSTGMFFPAQCTPLNSTQDKIRCPATGIKALYVRTGTGTVNEGATSDSITILAPTPATLTGGSVTNIGGPRTTDITAGPAGGDVIYGNPGSGTLDSKNGFPDTVHSCPGNTVSADSSDTVIPDCATPPGPPTPPPAPPPPPGAPTPPPTVIPPPTAPSSAISLAFKRLQHIVKDRAVVLSISVATPLTVTARGTIALPGGAGIVRLVAARHRIRAAAQAVTIRLRVPRRKVKALRHAFAKHRRLYANVQVNANDPASGSSFALARRIPLAR